MCRFPEIAFYCCWRKEGGFLKSRKRGSAAQDCPRQQQSSAALRQKPHLPLRDNRSCHVSVTQNVPLTRRFSLFVPGVKTEPCTDPGFRFASGRRWTLLVCNGVPRRVGQGHRDPTAFISEKCKVPCFRFISFTRRLKYNPASADVLQRVPTVSYVYGNNYNGCFSLFVTWKSFHCRFYTPSILQKLSGRGARK